MLGGLSGGCRAGITLEKCSQLAVVSTQPAWLVEDGVPRCSPLPCFNLVPFGRWRHARGRECCREELISAPPGGYEPDSAKAEGSSIVDEPGSAEPLCARIKGANWEISEEKAYL